MPFQCLKSPTCHEPNLNHSSEKGALSGEIRRLHVPRAAIMLRYCRQRRDLVKIVWAENKVHQNHMRFSTSPTYTVHQWLCNVGTDLGLVVLMSPDITGQRKYSSVKALNICIASNSKKPKGRGQAILFLASSQNHHHRAELIGVRATETGQFLS